MCCRHLFIPLFCVLQNSLNLTDSLHTAKRCYVSPWTFSPMGKRLGNCLDFINRARCVCGFRLMAFRLWRKTEAWECPAAVRPELGERVNPLTHISCLKDGREFEVNPLCRWFCLVGKFYFGNIRLRNQNLS